MSRSRLQSRRRAVLAVLTLATIALAACSSGSVAPPAPGPSIGQQVDAPLPPAVSSILLDPTTGRPVSLASLHGKVVVISDMMTLCQETCPVDTADVIAAARSVEQAGLGGKVEFLSVTIDPGRDTRAQLAAYRALYAPAPADWAVVGGGAAGLAALWKRLGVYIQRVPDRPPLPRNWRTHAPLTYDLTHSDELFFLDRSGHERFILEGAPHLAPGAPVPGTLRQFLDGDGRANLAHPDPMAWTLPQELQVIGWLAGHRVPSSS